MTDNLDQAVLDEALMPELSEDFFNLEIERDIEVQSPEGSAYTKREKLKRRIQIKPLKIKYQKQFAKAFTPIVDSIAMGLANNQYEIGTDENGKQVFHKKGFGDFSFPDWVSVAAGLLDQVDVGPKLIQILCHNDGFMVTDEELDESDLQPEQQRDIILKFCKKSGDLERQVADFFQVVLPLVKNEVTGWMTAARLMIENTEEKTDSENTEEKTDSENTAS